MASIIDLGPNSPAEAFAINREGWVTGQAWLAADRDFHAFVWTPRDGMRVLGSIQGPNPRTARAINDWGQITGGFGTGVPFLWDRGHAVVLHGLENGGESRGINYRAQIVGSYFPDPITGARHAYIWTPKAGVRDLGQGSARGLNDVGQVVGDAGFPTHPVTWGPLSGERALDLPNLPNASGAAWAINLRGVAAGDWIAYPPNEPAGVAGAALWTSDGAMHDLGHLPCGRRGPDAVAMGINSADYVVGQSCTSDPTSGTHAFLFRNGRMVDLNSLLPPGSAWTLVTANAVNDRGQIVGAGLINGEQHAYRLSLPRVGT